MENHDVISIPIQFFRALDDDDEMLKSSIADRQGELRSTGTINILDDKESVIRSFKKDEVANIWIWVKTYRSLEGNGG
jgi:hypothetical protein